MQDVLDGLVDEYLVYRGLAATSRELARERSSPPAVAAQSATALCDMVLAAVRTTDLDLLMAHWVLLKQHYFAHLEGGEASPAVRSLESSVCVGGTTACQSPN